MIFLLFHSTCSVWMQPARENLLFSQLHLQKESRKNPTCSEPAAGICELFLNYCSLGMQQCAHHSDFGWAPYCWETMKIAAQTLSLSQSAPVLQANLCFSSCQEGSCRGQPILETSSSSPMMRIGPAGIWRSSKTINLLWQKSSIFSNPLQS